jgi:imidazole glycerol-phosphate synthase subunit HisH
MDVAVVDYGMGNLHSVRNALSMVGADVVVTSDPDELRRADRIVLPGVGAFGECVKNLRASGVLETLEEEVLKKAKPMLGICLGMQVLATRGDELGDHEGLGWIPGRVRRFTVDETQGLRVPHVGWNEVHVSSSRHPVLAKMRKDASFYFVHSYFFEPVSAEHTAATCDYGGEFTCAVARGTIIATQFHPEKSQQVGLSVLEAFLDWKP